MQNGFIQSHGDALRLFPSLVIPNNPKHFTGPPLSTEHVFVELSVGYSFLWSHPDYQVANCETESEKKLLSPNTDVFI